MNNCYYYFLLPVIISESQITTKHKVLCSWGTSQQQKTLSKTVPNYIGVPLCQPSPPSPTSHCTPFRVSPDQSIVPAVYIRDLTDAIHRESRNHLH